MRVRWTPAALADLHGINEYLKTHSSHYRQPIMRKLYETVGALKKWPERGRPGSEIGTREIRFLPLPYIAVYRVKEQTIEVLRICTVHRIALE